MQQQADVGLSYSRDNARQFEQIFKTHFKALHGYACTIVKDEIVGEEMVQNVFYKLWEKKEQIEVQQSVAAYLYRAVYYESLNHLKHEKVKASHQSFAMQNSEHERDTASDRTMLRELEVKLEKALKELPEQCRTIFQMSRFEELKYREIADRLGLSIKTVENQMGKALRLLRLTLVDYLPLFLLLLPDLLKFDLWTMN